MTIDALNNVTTDAYTNDGQLQSQTVGVGSAAQSTTSYVYNGDGQDIELIDGDGNETDFTYNSADQQTGERDGFTSGNPAGVSESFTYDGDDNLVESIDFDGRTIQYGFNSDDQLISEVWIAADGVTVTNSFSFREIQRCQEPFSGPRTTMFFDKVGNMTGVTDANGNGTSYVYDADNLQTVTIDALGNRTTGN